MQRANDLIKKANRYVEMCGLLCECEDWNKVNACFAWIEHSNMTPQEIYRWVFGEQYGQE
jgi:hypothetical protein